MLENSYNTYMINVYIDPSSYVNLGNALFQKGKEYNANNSREWVIFLKEYCAKNGIRVQTIDMWSSEVAKPTDVYVSFDHKILARKLYWKLRDKQYPIVDPEKFAKRILFQFEPPVVIPEIRYVIKKIPRLYDNIFFTWKTGNPNIRHFFTPLPIPESRILPEYWANTDRKFLVLINSNRRQLSYYKELLTERIRAILFFSKTGDIDLYGRDWDKPLPFPYWFHKGVIRKVYGGVLENKYEKLSQYTFAFAYENCELPGYITDKIFDCFYVGTVPIYLGAFDVEEYIPKDCFIDMRDFKNYQELRTFLKSLSKEQVQAYKENARRFIESDQIKPFANEYFGKTFVRAIQQG
jgi:alpha(1,3/1,4) fucosyltransferase